MTDEDLEKQILQGLKGAIMRYLDNNPGIQFEDTREVAAIYLSGALQAVHYMVRKDGEITAHQFERALVMAGDRLGMELGRP